jgi:hypothetical protein
MLLSKPLVFFEGFAFGLVFAEGGEFFAAEDGGRSLYL